MKNSQYITLLSVAFAVFFALSGCGNGTGPYNSHCGNGELDKYEICDGGQFREGFDTCNAYNPRVVWRSGSPACSLDCELEQGTCTVEIDSKCHNNELDPGEDCDGTLFAPGKDSCSAFDPSVQWQEDGMPACTMCRLSIGTCKKVSDITCGNDVLDIGEPCDGALFPNDDRSCSVYDAEKPWLKGGEVGCEACEITIGSCQEAVVECDNGVLEDGEPCDGALFPNDDRSCSVFDAQKTWLEGGKVDCEECKITIGSCQEAAVDCGNGVLEDGEPCDGALFRNDDRDCKLFNPTYNYKEGGEVGCEACKLTIGSCEEDIGPMTCRDGVLSETEKCDNDDLVNGPSACVSLENLVGTAYYDDLSIFWIGKPKCAIACDSLQTGTCRQSTQEPVELKRYLTGVPADTSAFNEEGVTLSNLNYVEWEETFVAWVFATWNDSTDPHLPALHKYIDFAVGDVSAYSYVSISLNYRRANSLSANDLAVLVYDGSEYKQYAMKLRHIGFKGWLNSGSIVVPTESIADFHFRITAHTGGGNISVKDVIIHGFERSDP
ncbi:MAG: hypothetical protein WC966_01635 [Bradymonadales bacterium]